jgi:hypothetical protein
MDESDVIAVIAFKGSISMMRVIYVCYYSE